MDVIVDRIEGDYAVVEIEKGKMCNLPLVFLPNVKEGDVVTITINKGKTNSIEVFANEDYSVTTRKGQEAELDVNYQLPKIINAPLKQGQIIGRAIISKDGTLIKEIDLIVKENVEALSYKDCVDRIATQW